MMRGSSFCPLTEDGHGETHDEMSFIILSFFLSEIVVDALVGSMSKEGIKSVLIGMNRGSMSPSFRH